MEFLENYFEEVAEIAKKIDTNEIEQIVKRLEEIRSNNGRLFFLGVGGSAGNCGHAVNDFRKLCLFEAYAPTDNVSELTARTNDEGWNSVFSEWLKISKLKSADAVFIFSVGGGSRDANISANIVEAIDYANSVGASIFSIVGKPNGYAYKQSTNSILIPGVNDNLITPHSEAYQAVVWHSIVSHPLLKKNMTKWESQNL